MTDLPLPTTTRWMPLRAGLINIYRFDAEEFRFAGGRLLLRGNNGTGKTRALALLLPFLLDGEVRPARVEPDGNPNRRFEWHLLMDQHADRTGYAWLEFGRLEDGAPRYCTIGCGLRAVEGHTGLRARWFFTVAARPGLDLHLRDAAGTPLAREALVEHLAGRASVVEQAAEHRRSVDAALYGLGAARYATLVDLLIELRRPQLTRELDEERLSRALSDALPGLERRILDDVADGYRNLERDAAELAGLDAAHQAVADFNAVHRRHLQAEGTALADGVRQAHGRYEHAQARLRETRAAQAAAGAALAGLDARLAALADEQAAALGEERALRGSALMQSAEIIDRLRGESEAAEAEAAVRRSACSVATDRETRAGLALAAATEAEGRTAATVVREERRLAEQAAVLGLTPGDDAPAQRRARLRAAQTSRREALAILRRLSRAAEQAGAQADEAVRGVHLAESRRDAQQLRCDEAATALDRSHDQHRTAIHAHRAGLSELQPEAADLADLLAAWRDEPEDSDPYELRLAVAAEARQAELAHEQAAIGGEVRTLRAEHELLQAEARRLAAGADLPPAPPAWRDDAARAIRPGAPLWRLCDFRPDCPEELRAGLEAALQAAGLLDAWVTPDGELRAAPDGECYLRAEAAPANAAIDRWLQPAADPADVQAAQVPAGRIAALLAAIGGAPGDGTTWVCPDGRFANGLLQGAWTKPAAAHLGAGARTAARRARLAAIAAELAALAQRLAALDARANQAAQRQRIVATERATRPDPAPVRRAHRAHHERLQALDEARRELATAQERAARLREQAAAAAYALRAEAAAAGLAAWCDRLDELHEALYALETALLTWWNACELAQAATTGRTQATAQAAEAAQAVGEARERLHDGERQAAGLASELRTLEASVGSAVGELLVHLAALRQRLRLLDDGEQQARRERDGLLAAVARADQARLDAETRLAELTAVRDEALARLRQTAGAGLLAGLGEMWRRPLPDGASDTTVVELAQQLARDSGAGEAGEEARDRLASQVNERFQQLHLALSSHDLLPSAARHQGIISVRVHFRGAERDVAELGGELAAEVAQRRQLLTARERELVENFLLDQAAEHLHDLLHAADAWVVAVNRELTARPTSTGMALRFRWQEGETAPGGLAEARAILLRPQHAWSPADRGLLAGFLGRCIAAERERDAGSPWSDCLAAALDYRRWHRFAVERQQGGHWTRLTRRTHGTGSGGEKALALTLPMFAAAAAHYAAAPLAPRLILLDEAFVGIDQDMRRQCMGLLAAFDLDVVMTSEREWGCYDTVPAIAICQLAAESSGGCVALTRYVWNGRERRREDA